MDKTMCPECSHELDLDVTHQPFIPDTEAEVSFNCLECPDQICVWSK